jgi:hypothetical protein
MTPSPHSPHPLPSKPAIDTAFRDLIGQTDVKPETVITFARLAAQQDITQSTKDALLGYAVAKSAMSTREDIKNVDDALREKLRDLVKTMIGLGADVNYRATESTAYRGRTTTASSLLDIAYNANDDKMRKLLHDHGAFPGRTLDLRNSHAPRISPASRNMLRGFKQEDRDDDRRR